MSSARRAWTGRLKVICATKSIRPAATYTASTAAETLKIGPSTISNAVVSGELPATRYPGGTYIKGADLLDWAEERNWEAEDRQRRTTYAREAIRPDVWYSVRQAAATAHVDIAAVRAATKSGALPAERHPTITYIKGSALLSWLRGYREGLERRATERENNRIKRRQDGPNTLTPEQRAPSPERHAATSIASLLLLQQKNVEEWK